MSDSAGTAGDRRVAFNEMASDLGLTPERRSELRMQSRTVGFLLLAKMDKGPEVDTAAPPMSQAIGPEDDQAIKGAIVGWETMHPEDAPGKHHEHTTNPFVGVGEFMAFTDAERMHNYLNLDHYTKGIAPTLHSPRKVEVHDLNITYLSQSKAVATYRVEEELKDGGEAAWNSGAILVKGENGWRLAVMAK